MITLGIIGIIAAMTVPNLVNNYRKSQAETGLKEAYSILSNAITMAAAENGSVAEMIDNCTAFTTYQERGRCFVNNYLKPYLKYSKSCDADEKSSTDSRKYCMAEFYAVSEYKDLDGNPPTDGRLKPHVQTTLALENGIFVGVFWNDKQIAPYITVDVNGAAGPNQTGADYFFFALYDYHPNEKFLKSGYANVATSLKCENMVQDYYYYDYKNNGKTWCKETNRMGTGCACLVQSNGWKFPKDYPIKKF